MSVPPVARPAPSVARLIVLQALALLAAGVVTISGPSLARFHGGDLGYYYRAAALTLGGHLPYRDFPFDYPPLALPVFCLPWLATMNAAPDGTTYAWAFLIQSILLKVSLSLTLARICAGGRFGLTPGQALLWETVLVISSAALLPWRYDLFPALLTLLALGLLLGQRAGWAGVCLGLGIGAKLYPLVLVPVFAMYLLAGRDRRGAGILLAGTAGAVLFSLLPFAGAGLATPLDFLRLHERRGLEVESLAAGAILLAHKMGLTDARIVLNFYAFHLDAPAAAGALRCLPWAFIATYGSALWIGWRRFRREDANDGTVSAQGLVNTVVAALLCFLLCNKVFSTQYIFWLLPFVALLRRRPALGFACLLTSLLYPYSFPALLHQETWAVLLLNARNLVLVLALGGLLAEDVTVRLSTPGIGLPIMRRSVLSGESR